MDRTTLLVRSKIKSHTTLELVNKLRGIWDNPHFVLNAVVLLETDEERQKLLDIIASEKLTNPDDIIYAALDIEDGYI